MCSAADWQKLCNPLNNTQNKSLNKLHMQLIPFSGSRHDYEDSLADDVILYTLCCTQSCRKFHFTDQ